MDKRDCLASGRYQSPVSCGLGPKHLPRLTATELHHFKRDLSAATWQVCRSVILSASAIHAPDPPRPVFLPGHRRTNPWLGCSNGFGVRYLLYRHMENRFGGGRTLVERSSA